MLVFTIRQVLCVLGCVVGASCVSEYEGNYADNYDNEISQDQQEGPESPTTPCQTAEFSRWDKLFIALEDSHMRQNMLLESLEQCCGGGGGMSSLRTQVEKLATTTARCQQCVVAPSVESSACRAQVEQVNLRLQRGLVQLREEGAERERRLNATLQMLLHSSHEGNVWLKRLEEGGVGVGSGGHGGGHRAAVTSSGPGDGSRMRHHHHQQQPTPRPGGFTLGMMMKPGFFESQQEATSPLDMATMERALVAIATELQRVHLQLSRVIERAGVPRKDSRGDT